MVRKRDRKGGALNVASPFKSNLFIFCAAINKEQEKPLKLTDFRGFLCNPNTIDATRFR